MKHLVAVISLFLLPLPLLLSQADKSMCARNLPPKSQRFRVGRASTMSIVARDPNTGELGVAVESHYFSVGPVVPWAEAGVGAVATQANADPSYGALGLALMKSGKTASQTLRSLMTGDPEVTTRQIAMIDAVGHVAAYTGTRSSPAAGHKIGRDYSVQGNTMATPNVWPTMAEAFEHSSGDLADRMLAALDAGQNAGGDIRGEQTAALLVVSGHPTGQPWKDRLFDLRVEDSPHPIVELKRLVRLRRAYLLVGQGDELAARKQWEEAIQKYRSAASLAPEKDEIAYGLAVTLFLAGREAESLPIFRQIFREHPQWVEITRRYVTTGDLPNDPDRIKRILDQAPSK
jgi:uncharacterized Ntn-hydrolase superfamily protein